MEMTVRYCWEQESQLQREYKIENVVTLQRSLCRSPSHSSPLLNSTGSAAGPTVDMRILDLNTQQEVSSTQIGQELQLIIEMKPANSK
jgi:hypothetical protein